MSYNASTNSSGCSVVTQLCLQGGTLVLDSTDIKSGVGVHVEQDSVINIGTGRTLADSQVSSVANGATLTLTGSGTYSLAVGQIGETASLTSGVALATGESGFTGTVLLNKDTTLNGTDLSALTNGSYSSVTMNGVSGTLKSGEISTNLVLKDYYYSEFQEGEVAAEALTIDGAGSITFSGAISGGGEMKIAPTDAEAENTLIFSGDVSRWTGQLEVYEGKANVTFTGEAKEINAYIADRVSESELNMVVDASESRSFTEGISADTLRLTNGTEGKVVDVSSGSYIVSTKTDLTESNVILQVKGTEDSNLYSSLTELAADGSSGINISDGEKTLTTIRTNKQDNTQDASSSGGATLSYCTFTYNNSTAKILGTTIDRAVIDVLNGSTLELSGVVLTNSCWVHDDDAGTPKPNGNLVLEGVELQMAKGTASTEDGSGVALTLTGGTKAATNADGSAKMLTGKVYVMDLTQISDFATISGSKSGLTLNFNTYGNGFAELYETLKGYDYVAVKFSDDVLSIDFSTLVVNAKITNGEGKTGTTTGYYAGGENGVVNSNGTSGVVVYFDAMALPEPTTSTLALLALTALCARRRRTQATR